MIGRLSYHWTVDHRRGEGATKRSAQLSLDSGSSAGGGSVQTADLQEVVHGIVQAADVLIHDCLAPELLVEVGKGDLRHGGAAQWVQCLVVPLVPNVHLHVNLLHHIHKPAVCPGLGPLVLADGFQQPGVLGLRSCLQSTETWPQSSDFPVGRKERSQAELQPHSSQSEQKLRNNYASIQRCFAVIRDCASKALERHSIATDPWNRQGI